MRSLLVLALLGSASAFVAAPVRPTRGVAPRSAAAPAMLIEQVDATTIDSTTQLLAGAGMVLPIPAFSPAKGALMMFCNILIICTMSIQGKGLSRGTPHDEMVESFGITWLLSGTSLGHIVGAGAILGCEAAGIL